MCFLLFHLSDANRLRLWCSAKQIRFVRTCSLFAVTALGIVAGIQQPVSAQDILEEVVVTGSLIKGSPTDAANPINVYRRNDLALQNNPSLSDFTKSLSVSSGVDGESNPFQSRRTEGLANINLRGLGPARTLVLINGQRQVGVPVRLSAGRFVDLNSLPAASIERIEILKEGAAATYGSDAIGGVANFITRANFEGIELSLDYANLENSNGDASGSVIVGIPVGNGSWVTSAAVRHRSQLLQRDREWSVRLDGEYLPYGGWSSIGNPGTLYAFSDTSAEGDGPGFDTLIDGPQPDPGCQQVGAVVFGGVCNFNYTFFDNIVEEQTQWQIFSEYNGTLWNGFTTHAEFLIADTIVPEQATSPSFPPQQLVDPIQAVFPSNPAWESLASAYPSYFSGLSQQPDYIIVRGRVEGVGAQGPRTQNRNYRTYRLAGSIQGNITNATDFEVSASWSRSEGGYEERDARVERTKLAFRGFGGPDCGATLNPDLSINPNGAVAGAGACQYLNPFSTAIESGYLGRFVNSNFNAQYANDPELLNWIDDSWFTEGVNDLWTLDMLARASWGVFDWAAGGQLRRNRVRQGVDDVANIEVNPCRVEGDNSCTNRVGLHSYLAPITPYDVTQNTAALFLEAQTTLGDSLEMSFGLRTEIYSGGLYTLDPKIALQYILSDEWSLRSSFQTTFRAPDPNQQSQSVFTEQGYVSQTLAFKAIDTQGNPDLDPESAFTFNVGLVYSGASLQGAIDYWYFDFDNPIITESYNEIVAAYDAGGDRKAAVAAQVICPSGAADGSCTSALIERILPEIVNGPAVKTDGIDVTLKYRPFTSIDLDFGLEMGYTRSYSVASYSKAGMLISEQYEAAGYYNFNNAVRPVPDLKARLLTTYQPYENTTVTMTADYVSSYQDRREPAEGLRGSDRIDSWLTFDMHFAYQMNDQVRVVLSVINATDEQPPLVYGDLMYDSYSHNALGRLIKLGINLSYN